MDSYIFAKMGAAGGITTEPSQKITFYQSTPKGICTSMMLSLLGKGCVCKGVRESRNRVTHHDANASDALMIHQDANRAGIITNAHSVYASQWITRFLGPGVVTPCFESLLLVKAGFLEGTLPRPLICFCEQLSYFSPPYP